MFSTRPTPFYEDVQEGSDLPSAEFHFTLPIMIRWVAANEIWSRNHYDKEYSVAYENLPDAVGSGSWTRGFLYSFLSSWAGLDGWVWKSRQQNRAPLLPGDEITAWGRVVKKEVKDGLGYVEVDTGLRDREGREKVPGHATVVLPLRGGRSVPYPFVPPA